ncbi:hypothetical protein ACLOJK_028307 [Asimina triloba]
MSRSYCCDGWVSLVVRCHGRLGKQRAAVNGCSPPICLLDGHGFQNPSLLPKTLPSLLPDEDAARRDAAIAAEHR